MDWRDEPTARQAGDADDSRELARQLHRAELSLAGLCALFLIAIGATIYVIFLQPSKPDTRIVRVDVASLTARPESRLRYPGATVLRHQESAGVSTLYAHYKASGGYGRGGPRIFTLLGYSGTAMPASASQLLSVHADAARVDAWYRGALLRRGWCVAGHDTARIPGTTSSATEVVYVRGHERYELDFGDSHLVRGRYGGDEQGDAQEAALYKWFTESPGAPTDPAKLDRFIRSLEDPANAPLTVFSNYELYPDGTDAAAALCSTPPR